MEEQVSLAEAIEIAKKVQRRPDGATFEITGGAYGATCVLRMPNGDVAVIAISNSTLLVVAKRWWWFPKQLFSSPVSLMLNEWDAMGLSVKLLVGSIIIRGVLEALVGCGSARDIQGTCKHGLTNPLKLGHSRFREEFRGWDIGLDLT